MCQIYFLGLKFIFDMLSSLLYLYRTKKSFLASQLLQSLLSAKTLALYTLLKIHMVSIITFFNFTLRRREYYG